MRSIWSKLKDVLVGKEESPSENIPFSVDNRVKVSVDEQFADNFIKSGGQFLYCQNPKEALIYLDQIIQQENISRFICFDENLQVYLNTLQSPFIMYPSASVDFVFMSCEALIAFDGSIMVSSNQSKGRKLEDLPDNFIIHATPSMFKQHLSDALQTIRQTQAGNLPTNITTIRGHNMQNMSNVQNAKNIYLLLVEDE